MDAESYTDSLRFSAYNDYQDEELEFSDDNEGSILNSVPESLFQVNTADNNARHVSDYEEIGMGNRGQMSSTQERRIGTEREPPPEYNNHPDYPYHPKERQDGLNGQMMSEDDGRKADRRRDYHRKETLQYDEAVPERPSKRSMGRRLSDSRNSRLERQNQHLSFRSGSSNGPNNSRTPPRISQGDAGASRARVRNPDSRPVVSESSRDDYEEENPYETVADMEREINLGVQEEDELDGRKILELDEVDAPFVIGK